MTSRERLLALLNDQPVDRCGVQTYGLDSFNCPRLKADPRGSEVLALADAETEILLAGGPRFADAIFLSTSPEVTRTQETRREDDHTVTRTTLHTPRGELHNLSIHHEGVETEWQTEHYLKTDEDIERFLSMPHVAPEVLEPRTGVAAARVGERGLPASSVADPLCYVADLFEFGEWTVRAWQDTATIRRLLDFMAPRVYDLLDRELAVTVPGTVFRLVGTEYASEPYLSPALFREFVLPYDLPIAKKIHDAGCYVRIHSHGRLAAILDPLMELEPDLLEPVEGPPSGDITMAELAQRVGRRCILMGNLEPRELEFVAAEQIDDLVRGIMDSVAGKARLLLGPTDAPIAYPISPTYARNICRYIEAVLKWGPEYDWA